MVGMYQGVEFIVGTAEVVSANIRNEVGFDVVAMNRRGYRVYLKSFIITDFTESIDEKEAKAKNWASRFNMK
jgi:hypothetical protein